MEYGIDIKVNVIESKRIEISPDDFETAYADGKKYVHDVDALVDYMFDALKDLAEERADDTFDDVVDISMDDNYYEDLENAIKNFVEEKENGPDYANAPGQMHLEFED